jgi:hypothetical protein
MARKSELVDRVEYLQDANATLQSERDGLRAQISASEGVTRIALNELADPARVGLIEGEAEKIAVVAVVTEETERLKEVLSGRIKTVEGPKIAARVRAEKGPGIKRSLIEQFKDDGTFDGLRADAEQTLYADLESGVLADKKQKIEEELSDPEHRAKVEADIRERLSGSRDLEQFRADVRRRNEEAWTPDVEAEIREEIEGGEAAREPDFKSQKKDEIRGSQRAKTTRDEIRRSHEKTWGEALDEEVASEIGDEELAKLLEAKAELACERLAKEVAAEKLLSAFEGRGLETSGIQENARLEVFLGHIKTYNDIPEEYKDRWDDAQTRNSTGPGVECYRKLTLTSLGDGRFIVDGDSLDEDGVNEYIREHALERGSVIVIGRKISENSEVELERRVAADAILYLDDDTSTPHITNAMYPIANIKVDGVSARDVRKVELV